MLSKITLKTIPHFIIKDQEIKTETKEKLWQESLEIFPLLLNMCETLEMEFIKDKSSQFNQESVQVNYYLDNPNLDLQSLTSNLNYFHFDTELLEQKPVNSQKQLRVFRQLKFVPVGDLNYRCEEPRIMTIKRNLKVNSDGEDSNNSVMKSHLIPIPQCLNLFNDNYKWKNLLFNIANFGGSLSIKIRKIIPSQNQFNYSMQCLNDYHYTYEDKIPTDEFNQRMNLYQTIVSKEEIFAVSFKIDEENFQRIKLAFLQDLDPNAFNSEGIDAKFLERIKSLDESRQNFINSLQYYWTQKEVIKLFLTPPYSFEHALAGMKNIVPKPFLIPFMKEDINQQGNGHIFVGKLDNGKPIYLDSERIRQHLFVTGTTGSGKTNTTHHLFSQLQQKTPILVIDPIKREYEEVMIKLGYEDKIIDFKDGRYPRFNPFIPPKNITVYAHCSVLAKTLSLLCPTNETAYEMIANMVIYTYQQKIRICLEKQNKTPWKYPQDLGKFLDVKGEFLIDNPVAIPTFNDFLNMGMYWLRQTVNPNSRWGSEAIEYFTKRWAILRNSIFFEIFNNNNSVEKYFQSHYLIELYNILDQDQSNALFAILIALLYEYRLSEGLQETLQHITIVEEAHRIIPAQQKGLGDNKVTSSAHEAAQLIAQMLAEIRAYGEGIIVVDQSPSKILSDVLINCLTKIVHRTSYGADKDCLAEALNLSSFESDYLSSLEIGKAIASLADAYQPVHLNIPRKSI